jgi:hypothetical protein
MAITANTEDSTPPPQPADTSTVLPLHICRPSCKERSSWFPWVRIYNKLPWLEGVPMDHMQNLYYELTLFGFHGFMGDILPLVNVWGEGEGGGRRGKRGKEWS